MNESTILTTIDPQTASFDNLESKLILDVRTTTSCDYHRIVMPFSYCDIQPKVPVFMFNRIASYGYDFLFQLKKDGAKIVMDIDDHYQLDPSHYLYSTFLRNGMMQHLISNLKLADVVTTTTPLLASKLRHLNPNIVVIPNALPYDQDQFVLSPDIESKTPIIWCGGASHYNDLKEIQGIPLGDKMTFVGFNPENTEWKKINIDHPDVTYEGEIKLPFYMRGYNGHQFAIAPLGDSIFNSCKSNLKVLEAGAKGIPIICSRVEPYFNSVDKQVVVYADNKVEWHDQMTKLLTYKDLCADRGAALAEHVRLHYNLKDANELRRQVIESFS